MTDEQLSRGFRKLINRHFHMALLAVTWRDEADVCHALSWAPLADTYVVICSDRLLARDRRVPAKFTMVNCLGCIVRVVCR